MIGRLSPRLSAPAPAFASPPPRSALGSAGKGALVGTLVGTGVIVGGAFGLMPFAEDGWAVGMLQAPIDNWPLIAAVAAAIGGVVGALRR